MTKAERSAKMFWQGAEEEKCDKKRSEESKNYDQFISFTQPCCEFKSEKKIHRKKHRKREKKKVKDKKIKKKQKNKCNKTNWQEKVKEIFKNLSELK